LIYSKIITNVQFHTLLMSNLTESPTTMVVEAKNSMILTSPDEVKMRKSST